MTVLETRTYRRPKRSLNLAWWYAGPPPEAEYEYTEVPTGPDYTVRVPGGWVSVEAFDDWALANMGWERVGSITKAPD